MGVAFLTTWTSIGEVLELYCAVMLCDPAVRLEVVIVAVAPEIILLPILVDPSKKVIVPVLPVATAPVKVTVCV